MATCLNRRSTEHYAQVHRYSDATLPHGLRLGVVEVEFPSQDGLKATIISIVAELSISAAQLLPKWGRWQVGVEDPEARRTWGRLWRHSALYRSIPGETGGALVSSVDQTRTERALDWSHSHSSGLLGSRAVQGGDRRLIPAICECCRRSALVESHQHWACLEQKQSLAKSPLHGYLREGSDHSDRTFYLAVVKIHEIYRRSVEMDSGASYMYTAATGTLAMPSLCEEKLRQKDHVLILEVLPLRVRRNRLYN
ncbi:hypothetical protein SCAR479_07475 [Seiridium cardinale]|uniref:Uncharacterized protein n=1 Tax=Seiridium cardinale TaxID=138064 RepID=A0ABR2XQ62_9PEZI